MEAFGHALGARPPRTTRARRAEAQQVLALDIVQLEHPREGLQDLNRRMHVATPFEPEVVVRADAGEHRDLLPPKTRNPPVLSGGQPDPVGGDELATRAQVRAQPVRVLVGGHGTTVPPSTRGRGGPVRPR